MNYLKYSTLISVCFLSVTACNNHPHNNTNEQTLTATGSIVSAKGFIGETDHQKTGLYVLKNKNNMEAAFTNYGGRIVSLLVPDSAGKLIDVVVGFNSVDGYKKSTEPYFGATIGRYGNRIAKGKFTLGGKAYQLVINNTPNTLHGGKPGFQSVVWNAGQPDNHSITFTYLAKDMEGGFPGNLSVKVTYSLTDNNELKMEYQATTDKATVVNLTNHAFFNLNGEGSGDILHHSMQIYADQYTAVDSTLIPDGKLSPVKGTPFDFTKPHAIGERINDNNIQLKNGKGYDHNFVLSGPKVNGMVHAATVTGDKSGIVMDVYTQEPGLQFYSGNFMQGKNKFKTGVMDKVRTAFAMETQHFPNSPNQPNFPSTTLKPGDQYHTVSTYQFKWHKNQVKL